MDVFKIIALSIGSFIVLFILAKLMGNREMAQLSMFDYIISITIGSIAAEMATSLEDDFTEPLVAMIVYAIRSYYYFIYFFALYESKKNYCGYNSCFI